MTDRPLADARPAPSIDLIVAAGHVYTTLLGGFLAGICVFVAPLVVVAIGLMAAYLADVSSDGTARILGLSQPLTRADFQAVFAPVVNQAPVMVSAGIVGAILAAFRRWMAKRADPAFLAAEIRPFFPEFTVLYVLLVILTLGMAVTHGGSVQVARLIRAAPVYLPFMLCATWLTHAVWHYCFRNIVDLLASGRERDAASELRQRTRPFRGRRR